MNAQLRDLLATTASVDPDLTATERAAAVARRGRAARRRDRVLVGAAAAVLVAAVAVPVALSGGDAGPDAAQPAPTASPCPAGPVDLNQPAGPIDLDAVTAVRACVAASKDNEVLPGPPITGASAAAFAEDLAALPAWKMSRFCLVTSVPVEPWALQVETADGATAYLGSPMRLCSSVDVDGVALGVDAVVAAFQGNQARQESGLPELACPSGDRLADGAPTWNASFDVSTATAGVVCYRGDPMGQSDYGDLDAIDATLSAVHGQLDAVRDDLAAHRRSGLGSTMCTDTGPQRMVLLEDADGDQAAWVDDRCAGTFVGPGGTWRPGAAAEQAIDEALRGR